MSGDVGVIRGVNYQDPIVKYRGEKIIDSLKKLIGRRPRLKWSLAVDVYYSFYLPCPIVDPGKASTVHGQLINMLLSSDKAAKARSFTVANYATSIVASVCYLQYLLEELEHMASSPRSRTKGLAENILSQLSGKQGGQNSEAERALKEIHEKALDRALKEAEAAKQIMKIAGGKLAGTGHTISFEEIVSDVIRLARNADVRRILEVLKGMPGWAIRPRRKKARHPKGELAGYELGSDIERVVYSELAMPEPLFYAKLAESQLLLYEKVLPESLGPIYVLLDKSGSMDGEKIVWAKATALALLMRAQKERRPFYIRFFDNAPYPLMKAEVGDKGILRVFNYVARVKSGGGTDISRAVITACEDIVSSKSKGASDIVLLTDGEDKVAEGTVRYALRSANARLLSVMIQGDNPDLRRVSDKYMTVVKLDEKEALKVVEL